MGSQAILEAIGDAGLLLPELLRDGLAANDRIKYYLTLLQAASAHAQQPASAVADLHGARAASGIADGAEPDEIISGSRLVRPDAARIPGAETLRERLFDDVRRMLEPLRATSESDIEHRQLFASFHQRLDRHLAATAAWAGDEVPLADIVRLTRVTAGNATDDDTLHRLVMDAHRALNTLVAALEFESVAGARASGLTDADRALVSAFMRGVHATAALKFDHPGLATTAIRYGDVLSIQNDLGTTDAHLIVVRVHDDAATVVYSDVHRKRVHFFQDLFDTYPLDWEAPAEARGGDEGPILVTGSFRAATPARLAEFLEYLGSRLVFLIDWNRARKRLARVIGKPEAIAVLRWAADHDVGHRAFLQAGGVELIQAAFERVAPTQTRYGARLDELLGADAAVSFVRAILRIASTRLAAGGSLELVQDEIDAELQRHLQTTERRLLETASDHAMLLTSMADRLRRTVARLSTANARDDVARTATLANTWEQRADAIVQRCSRTATDAPASALLRNLLVEADNVVDALEEAAFLLTLASDAARHLHGALLAAMADLVGTGAREYVRGLEFAKDCSSRHASGAVNRVLECVDRIAAVEHACDAAERSAKAAFIAVCADHRDLFVLFESARQFEQAADSLARCARTLRDYVLHQGAASHDWR